MSKLGCFSTWALPGGRSLLEAGRTLLTVLSKDKFTVEECSEGCIEVLGSSDPRPFDFTPTARPSGQRQLKDYRVPWSGNVHSSNTYMSSLNAV